MDYNASKDALFRPELSPTVFAAGSDPDRIALCVEACRLAYYKTESGSAETDRLNEALGRVGFSRAAPFCSGAFIDAQGFGAFRERDGLALLAFRGTEPDKLADLGTDADIPPVPGTPDVAGLVHQGFLNAFRALQPQVEAWLKGLGPKVQQLFICGHSLGAAMAMVAAHVFKPKRLVTIGCPRTGNAAFVNGLSNIEQVRIVDCADLVTELPPPIFGYTHPERFRYIDRGGNLHDNPPAGVVAEDQMAGRLEYLHQYAWRHGTVPLRDLADHAPLNYIRAFGF